MKNLLLILLVFVLAACGQNHESSLPVKQLEGGNNAIVLNHGLQLWAFLAPGCPLSEAAVLELKELSREFPALSIWVVIPGKLYDDAEVLDFKKKFGIEFPILQDTANYLENKFAAQITPEVFVTNDILEVKYQGAIDDRAIDLETIRPEAKNYYLRQSLSQLYAGTELTYLKTKAVGCFIEH
jgi:hypothetical protein